MIICLIIELKRNSVPSPTLEDILTSDQESSTTEKESKEKKVEEKVEDEDEEEDEDPEGENKKESWCAARKQDWEEARGWNLQHLETVSSLSINEIREKYIVRDFKENNKFLTKVIHIDGLTQGE